MPIPSRTTAGAVAILLAALAFTASGAAAQTVAETMARWGLIGTWSTDCRRPPGRTHYHLSYVVRGGGRVFHERDFGGHRDAREIRTATIRTDGLIEVVADFGSLGGVRRWAMIKGADGRIRTMANSKVDGTDATIRNGRFVVGNGAETVWQSKCQSRSKSLQEVRVHCPPTVSGMPCT